MLRVKTELLARYIPYPGDDSPRARILYSLLSAEGKPVSGQALAEKLGVTRPAIWKWIKRLIQHGFPVEAAGNRGYFIRDHYDFASPPQIADHLTTDFMGRYILYAPETGSTNDDAKTLMDACPGLPEGTLLLAESQSRGRGRLSRQWVSPRGGIFMSLILYPSLPPARIPALSLVAGYSVCLAIQSGFGLEAKLKWPNDVLIGGRKVAGLLCELRGELDKIMGIVVGIGINANIDPSDLPRDAAYPAASLQQVLGRKVDKSALIASVLNHFEQLYVRFTENGLEPLLPGILGNLAYVGQQVTVKRAGTSEVQTGTVVGIDPEGRLVLDLGNSLRVALEAGELTLRASS